MSANNHWQQAIRQVSQTTSSSSADTRAEHSHVRRTFSEVGRTIHQEVITRRVSKQYAYTRSGTFSSDQRSSSMFPTWGGQRSVVDSLTFNTSARETEKPSSSLVKITDFDNPDENASVRVVKTVEAPIPNEKKILVTQRKVLTDLDSEPEPHEIKHSAKNDSETEISQAQLAVEPAPKLRLSDLTHFPDRTRFEVTKTEVQELELPVNYGNDNVHESALQPITQSISKSVSTSSSGKEILSKKEESESSSDSESKDSLPEVLDQQNDYEEPLISNVSQKEYFNNANFSSNTFNDPNPLLGPVASEQTSTIQPLDSNQSELETETVTTEIQKDESTTEKLDDNFQKSEPVIEKPDAEQDTIVSDIEKLDAEPETVATDVEKPEAKTELVAFDVKEREVEVKSVATDFEIPVAEAENKTFDVENSETETETEATDVEKPVTEAETLVFDIVKPETDNFYVKKLEDEAETVASDVEKTETEAETLVFDVEKPEDEAKTVANYVEKTEIEAETPVFDVEKPDTEIDTVVTDGEQPEAEVETLVFDADKLEAEVETVATDVEKPEFESEAEVFDAEKVEVEAKTPVFDVEKPDTEVDTVVADGEQPEAEVETLVFDAEKLEAEVETVSADFQKPETESEAEVFDAEKVESEAEMEAFEVEKPKTEVDQIVIDDEQLESEVKTPVFYVEKPDVDAEAVAFGTEKPEIEVETEYFEVEKLEIEAKSVATDFEKLKAEAETEAFDVEKSGAFAETVVTGIEKPEPEVNTVAKGFQNAETNPEAAVATNLEEQQEEPMLESMMESFVVIKPDEENEPEAFPDIEQIDDDAFSSPSAVAEPTPLSIPISEPTKEVAYSEAATDVVSSADKDNETDKVEDLKNEAGDHENDRSSIAFGDGKRKFKPVSSSFNRGTSTISRHESLLRRNKSGSTSDLLHGASFSQSFNESSMDPELFHKMMRQRRKSGSEEMMEENIEKQLEKKRIERISSIRKMDVQKRYNPGKSEPDVRSYSVYKPHKIGKLDLNSHLSSMMDKHKKRFELKMKELYGEKYHEIDIDYDDIINYWRNKQKNKEDDLIFGTGRRFRMPSKGANQNEDDENTGNSGKQPSPSVQKTLDLEMMLQRFFADDAENDSAEFQKLLDDFIKKEEKELRTPGRKSTDKDLSLPHTETSQSLSESNIPQLLASPKSPGSPEGGSGREVGSSPFSDTQEWFETEASPKSKSNQNNFASSPLDADDAKSDKAGGAFENVMISHRFYTPDSSDAQPDLTGVTSTTETDATESSTQPSSSAKKDVNEEDLSEIQELPITNRTEIRVESSSKIWSSVATGSTGEEEFSGPNASITEDIPPLAVKRNDDEHDTAEHDQPMELQERSKETSESGTPGTAADSTVDLAEDPLDDINIFPKSTRPNTLASSALSVRDENNPPAVLEPNQMHKVESQVTLASGHPSTSETKRLIEKDPDAEPGCCRNCVIL